jgi:ATP-dependent DNA ligase
MPLLRLAAPFDHPDFLFELKLDGLRALAHIEGHHCRLVHGQRRAHTQRVGDHVLAINLGLAAVRSSSRSRHRL